MNSDGALNKRLNQVLVVLAWDEKKSRPIAVGGFRSS